MLSIKGMNKAQILAGLYNAAKSNGEKLKITKDMTIEEAEELLKKAKYFKNINGKTIDVDLRSDILDTYWYDRYNGEGTGYAVWKKIKDSLNS